MSPQKLFYKFRATIVLNVNIKLTESKLLLVEYINVYWLLYFNLFSESQNQQLKSFDGHWARQQTTNELREKNHERYCLMSQAFRYDLPSFRSSKCIEKVDEEEKSPSQYAC